MVAGLWPAFYLNILGLFLVDKSVEDLVVMLGLWPPLKVGVLVREGVVFG